MLIQNESPMKTLQIYEHLERIANLLRTDTRKSGIDKGLQPVQLEALHYLDCCNRYSNTPASVADYLGLTKGTVSQTLGVLESAGLIDKRPDEKDRRVVHLVLTEKGKTTLDATIPPQVLVNALERVAQSDQQIVLDALNRILRSLQVANRLKSFGECQTCRHHRIEEGQGRRCGLTGEVLQAEDIVKICREHASPEIQAGHETSL